MPEVNNNNVYRVKLIYLVQRFTLFPDWLYHNGPCIDAGREVKT